MLQAFDSCSIVMLFPHPSMCLYAEAKNYCSAFTGKTARFTRLDDQYGRMGHIFDSFFDRVFQTLPWLQICEPYGTVVPASYGFMGPPFYNTNYFESPMV